MTGKIFLALKKKKEKLLGIEMKFIVVGGCADSAKHICK